MPKHQQTPLERSVMAALRFHGSPEAVAEATGIPLAEVERIQAARRMDDRAGPHSMEMKLGSAYGSYWAELSASQTPFGPPPSTKPEAPLTITKVEFPWANPNLSMDDCMNQLARALREAREGRGVA